MAYGSPKSNRCLLDRDVPRKRICCFSVSRGRLTVQVCGFWSTCRHSYPCKKRGKKCRLPCEYLHLQILVIIAVRPCSARRADPAPARAGRSPNFPRGVYGGQLFTKFAAFPRILAVKEFLSATFIIFLDCWLP